MKIGIFDSGIGGDAIALSLQKSFPSADIITVNDRDHLPYGEKSQSEIIELTENAIQPLLGLSCDVIVIACNTATTQGIDAIRKRYPKQKFIGIEPMIKTASQITKNNVIAVCATPSTLSSNRYHHLVKMYGENLKIIEPDCQDWAYRIENNNLNQKDIKQVVESVCSAGADVIVLGCTHYHWIKSLIISQAADRARVIEPSEAIGRRVKELCDNH